MKIQLYRFFVKLRKLFRKHPNRFIWIAVLLTIIVFFLVSIFIPELLVIFIIAIAIMGGFSNKSPNSRDNTYSYKVGINSACCKIFTALSVELLRKNAEQQELKQTIYFEQVKQFTAFTSINAKKLYSSMKIKRFSPHNIKLLVSSIKNAYRIKILYSLFKIAIYNGTCSASEMEYLESAAKILNINHSNFSYIYSLFIQFTEKEEDTITDDSKVQKKLTKAYQILGASSENTNEELKNLFRRLAVENHPDKVTYLGIEQCLKAEIKFKEISEAYEYLKSYRNIV